MKSVIPILAILSLMLLAGCVNGGVSEEAIQNIGQAMDERWDATNSYYEVREYKNGAGEIMQVVETSWKKPGQEKSVLIEPKGRKGQGVLTNNEGSYFIHPEYELITTMYAIGTDINEKPEYVQSLRSIMRTHEIKVIGIEQVGKWNAIALELKSAGGVVEGTYELWLDQDTYTILKERTFDKNKNLVREVTVREFEFNPQLSDDEFDINQFGYPITQRLPVLTEQEVKTKYSWLLLPSELPKSVKSATARIGGGEGGNKVELTYGDPTIVGTEQSEPITISQQQSPYENRPFTEADVEEMRSGNLAGTINVDEITINGESYYYQVKQLRDAVIHNILFIQDGLLISYTQTGGTEEDFLRRVTELTDSPKRAFIGILDSAERDRIIKEKQKMQALERNHERAQTCVELSGEDWESEIIKTPELAERMIQYNLDTYQSSGDVEGIPKDEIDEAIGKTCLIVYGYSDASDLEKDEVCCILVS